MGVMPGQWIAKSCGNREKHPQHIHVINGVAYACFGYTPEKD